MVRITVEPLIMLVNIPFFFQSPLRVAGVPWCLSHLRGLVMMQKGVVV
jgi:hypothetical protein